MVKGLNTVVGFRGLDMYDNGRTIEIDLLGFRQV